MIVSACVVLELVVVEVARGACGGDGLMAWRGEVVYIGPFVHINHDTDYCSVLGQCTVVLEWFWLPVRIPSLTGMCPLIYASYGDFRSVLV